MRVVKKRFLIRKECKIGNAGLAKIDKCGTISRNRRRH